MGGGCGGEGEDGRLVGIVGELKIVEEVAEVEFMAGVRLERWLGGWIVG